MHELKEGETLSEAILGERPLLEAHQRQSLLCRRSLPPPRRPLSVRPECYTEHTLTCWFHGFTYDWRDGRLVEILSEADSALICKVGLKSYPTFERHQVIFVWIGERRAAEHP